MTELHVKILNLMECKVEFFKLASKITTSTDLVYDMEEIAKLNNEHPRMVVAVCKNNTYSSWLLDSYVRSSYKNADVVIYIKRLANDMFCMFHNHPDENGMMYATPMYELLGFK